MAAPILAVLTSSGMGGHKPWSAGTTLLLGLEGVAVQRVELAEKDGSRMVHVGAAEPPRPLRVRRAGCSPAR